MKEVTIKCFSPTTWHTK